MLKRTPFYDLRRLHATQRTELDAAWTRVMDSGRWIMGPELEQFEAEFAAHTGVAHAVGVASGLDALYLSLLALGIGEGDEVLVPAHTFIATWLAIVRVGATPVAVEPDAKTCLVNAAAFARQISPRTRALVAVHLYGSVRGIEDVVQLCRENNILLLEDAAQAHGALSSLGRAGSHGVAGCFSFYPSKNLGAFGDGGAVVTNDRELCERLRALRNYGSRARYVHDVAGINSRLDELQAALLRVRLQRLDAENARRAEIAALYGEQLKGIAGLLLPESGVPGSHVWHLYVVQTGLRNALQKHLAEWGCETLVHYPKPVYRWPPFEAFAPPAGSASDHVAGRVLSLPMAPYLRDDEVLAICDGVKAFFSTLPEVSS